LVYNARHWQEALRPGDPPILGWRFGPSISSSTIIDFRFTGAGALTLLQRTGSFIIYPRLVTAVEHYADTGSFANLAP
jgi:hypothetical protein